MKFDNFSKWRSMLKFSNVYILSILLPMAFVIVCLFFVIAFHVATQGPLFVMCIDMENKHLLLFCKIMPCENDSLPLMSISCMH